MTYTAAQLAILARAYCALTGISLGALGHKIFDNHKFFKLVVAGKDALSQHTGKASEWFVENWPADAPWPEAVPRAAANSEAA